MSQDYEFMTPVALNAYIDRHHRTVTVPIRDCFPPPRGAIRLKPWSTESDEERDARLRAAHENTLACLQRAFADLGWLPEPSSTREGRG